MLHKYYYLWYIIYAMQYLKNGINSPIRNHFDYIQWIALENCSDFFLTVNLIGDNTIPVINDPRRVFTKYFNCIITLEHIIDYMYYDSEYYSSNVGPKKYKNNILKQYPILQKISNYANAYKHCFRNSKPYEIDDKEDIIFNNGIDFNLKLLQESFRFWYNYINSKQIVQYKE